MSGSRRCARAHGRTACPTVLGEPSTIEGRHNVALRSSQRRNRLIAAFKQWVCGLGDDLPDPLPASRGGTQRIILIERKRRCTQRLIAGAKLDRSIWHGWKPSCRANPSYLDSSAFFSKGWRQLCRRGEASRKAGLAPSGRVAGRKWSILHRLPAVISLGLKLLGVPQSPLAADIPNSPQRSADPRA